LSGKNSGVGKRHRNSVQERIKKVDRLENGHESGKKKTLPQGRDKKDGKKKGTKQATATLGVVAPGTKKSGKKREGGRIGKWKWTRL